MSSASIDYLLLRTLHRMLRQQADLREQIDRGPKRLKQAKLNEDRFENELESARETLKSTRLMANEKQLQLGSREAKIEDLKGKRNACESNREFQLLNEQIAADEQANNVLSDEILEMLERIDELEAECEKAKANLAKAKSDTAATEEKVAASLAKLSSELDRVSKDREEAEKRIPITIKAEYLRLVEASGEDALAQTDRETCGNCYRTLTMQVIDQIMMQKPVFCQGCGSLMYHVQASAANS